MPNKSHTYNEHKQRIISQISIRCLIYLTKGSFADVSDHDESPFTLPPHTGVASSDESHHQSLPVHADDPASQSEDQNGEFFACQHCPGLFKHKKSLRRHLRNVHKIQPEFVCDQCDARFTNQHHMRLHVRRDHESLTLPLEDEKPAKAREEELFACEQCPDSFTSQQDLDVHVRDMHQAETSIFACKYCGSQYKHKRNLTAHHRQHHPEIRWQREICQSAGK